MPQNRTLREKERHMESNKYMAAAVAVARFALIYGVGFIATSSSSLAVNSFEKSGSLASARYSHTTSLLPDGQVMVAGGNKGSGVLGSAEIYNSATGTWATASPMHFLREQHIAVGLLNGKILVAGGSNGSVTIPNGEIFDPVSATWTEINKMDEARRNHSAVLLTNGCVLVAGGYDSGSFLSSVELFDPAADLWSSISGLSTGRRNHTATRLSDGRVLVVGGESVLGEIDSAEIYDPSTGIWSATGAMITPRAGHSATLLPNGRVLATGGWTKNAALASSEIYDPATGIWSAADHLTTGRAYHTATLLPNGKLLIIGGTDSGSNAINTAEVYQYSTDSWTTTASLDSARNIHGAILLTNGNVLVTGGREAPFTALASTAVYDSAEGTWSPTGPLLSSRSLHSATLLPSGNILVAGGFDGGSLATAELYNPVSGTWTATGSLPFARYGHTATLLPDGNVLVAGDAGTSHSGTSIYNPAVGTWSNTGILALGRSSHTATLLPNGKVLLAGGRSNSTPAPAVISSTELYDPAIGAWSASGSLVIARERHTATLMPNGKVLLVGGNGPSGIPLTTAELYDPSTGASTLTSSPAIGRNRHTATLLPNGKVLVIGGWNLGVSLATAEVYDPVSGTWTATSSLPEGREYHSASLLTNGKVLIMGGANSSGPSNIEALYDPAPGTWSSSGNPAVGRYLHTATLLPNGKLLVAGGSNFSSSLASADLYEVGLGFSNPSQPVLSTATFTAGKLTLTGSGFHGLSSASGGNGSQDSPTHQPVVQLIRLDNGQCSFLPYDPAGTHSNLFVQTATVAPFPGHALATVFTNGIPSASKIVSMTPPSVTSPTVENLTRSSATLGGHVTLAGGSAITSRGIVFAPALLNENPLIGGAGVTLITSPGDTGIFTVSASGLAERTFYAFKAFATNSFGTTYSPVSSFFTPSPRLVVEGPTGTPIFNGIGTLDFPEIRFGLTSDLTIILRNDGDADLTMISASILGVNAPRFSLISSPPASLPPGAFASFTIRFSPLQSGPNTSTLRIISDDLIRSPFNIGLSGLGLTAPQWWRKTHFDQIGNTGIAADLADPDDDGIANLLERAFNLDPIDPDNSILPANNGTTGMPRITHSVGPAGNILTLQYLRRVSATNQDLTYVPQVSSDLASWSAPSEFETVESIDGEWERVTIQDRASGTTKRFARVRVENNEP